jgi:5-deoxy-glucuronate isomerase
MTATTRTLHLPAGSAASEDYALEVTPESAGWSSSGLRVLELAARGAHTLRTGEDEVVVVPLSGALSVACDGEVLDLTGRPHVFAGPTDFAYLPREATAELSSEAGGRFALCSRQVNNFATAGVFEADSIIACEVITPGGNWSSYPPHKHDETSDVESELEEIYYFEVSPGPQGRPGVGYHRVYGTPERPIDVLAEVHDRDVVLVPHGWHGPSIAAPGYDLYYLNVMAGPGPERAWRIVDDPSHTWVRDSWEHEDVDPRLPLHAPASHQQNGATRP